MPFHQTPGSPLHHPPENKGLLLLLLLLLPSPLHHPPENKGLLLLLLLLLPSPLLILRKNADASLRRCYIPDLQLEESTSTLARLRLCRGDPRLAPITSCRLFNSYIRNVSASLRLCRGDLQLAPITSCRVYSYIRNVSALHPHQMRP